VPGDTSPFGHSAELRHIHKVRVVRLPSFDNEPIFDDPVIGFADADDPIFQDYKRIIGEYHLTPSKLVANTRIWHAVRPVLAIKIKLK
jgi:hypothetical protein